MYIMVVSAVAAGWWIVCHGGAKAVAEVDGEMEQFSWKDCDFAHGHVVEIYHFFGGQACPASQSDPASPHANSVPVHEYWEPTKLKN
jgi:hypothetical protein